MTLSSGATLAEWVDDRWVTHEGQEIDAAPPRADCATTHRVEGGERFRTRQCGSSLEVDEQGFGKPRVAHAWAHVAVQTEEGSAGRNFLAVRDAALYSAANLEQGLPLAGGLVAGGVGAVGAIGGWFLAGRATRPVRAASRAMTDQLTQKVELEAADAKQRQFVSDVAHELRTPLAALVAASDSLEDPATRDQAAALALDSDGRTFRLTLPREAHVSDS